MAEDTKNFSGSICPPGSTMVDKLGESDIPVPLTVDLGGDILTLSPDPRSIVDNKGYESKVVWAATYNDGSVITDSEGISTDHIDRKKIREFKLLDYKARTIVSVGIQPGQCFFYRRRTVMRTGQDVIEMIHLFGWRMLIGDEWIANVTFLFESDMHVEIGGFGKVESNLEESQQWKYEPNWREIDEVSAE